MQNDTIEQLTPDEMRMIDKMSVGKALAFMHYCAEEKLALATVDEYRAVLGGKRRTLYKAAADGKLPKFELAGHLYLSINA